MKKKTICVIPARGGSKRIPGKNIRPILGKPMLEWVIETCHNSGAFTEIIVSTDCERIRSIAEQCGASVPNLRSKKNSNDHATTLDALHECHNELTTSGKLYDYMFCVYPTATLVTTELIALSISRITQSKASTLAAVVKINFPIERCLRMNFDETIRFAEPNHALTRSQDLPLAYLDAAMFYIAKSSWFKEKKQSFIGNDCISMVVPAHATQDVDTLEDLEELERKMSWRLKNASI